MKIGRKYVRRCELLLARIKDSLNEYINNIIHMTYILTATVLGSLEAVAAFFQSKLTWVEYFKLVTHNSAGRDFWSQKLSFRMQPQQIVVW